MVLATLKLERPVYKRPMLFFYDEIDPGLAKNSRSVWHRFKIE
jgi:hypothetical protein